MSWDLGIGTVVRAGARDGRQSWSPDFQSLFLGFIQWKTPTSSIPLAPVGRDEGGRGCTGQWPRSQVLRQTVMEHYYVTGDIV